MTTVQTDPAGPAGKCDASVGLVLAGGGARGAYEMGALSVLLPYLEERGERPGIVLGTSIGALNSAYIGGTAHLPVQEAIEGGLQLWRRVGYDDLLGPLVSGRGLGRVLLYFGELLGVPGARVHSLLDTSPQARTVRELIPIGQLAGNVEAGVLASVAVVATAYATAGSVVFHHSGGPRQVPLDLKRAIRYVPTRLTEVHVQASAAIPAFFPAIHVDEPATASGWYGDGGTRLNTPIKPALKLGAKRVVVIGLNSSGLPAEPVTERPDVFDGAAQFVQALLADQLAQDVATLATVNSEVAERRPRPSGQQARDGHEAVPYIFIAPSDRLAIGRIASDIYRRHFSSLAPKMRSRDMAALGHILCADRNPVRGELLSFLFFEREFIDALIDHGREDAERWLASEHDDGPWRYGDPPRPEGPDPEASGARPPAKAPSRA